MSNEPTVQYQPPRLGKVYFGPNLPPKKPLYPIVPENPTTVYVIKNEKNAFDAIPRAVRFPSDTLSSSQEIVNYQEHKDHKALFSSNDDSSSRPQNTFVWPPEPVKESDFADNPFDVENENERTVLFPETTEYEYTYDYPVLDLDASFSEDHAITVPLSEKLANSDTNSHNLKFRYSLTTSNPNDYYEDEYGEGDHVAYDYYDDHNGEIYEESESGRKTFKKVPPQSYFKDHKKHFKQDTVQIDELQLKSKHQNEWQSPKPWFVIATKTEKPEIKRDPSIAAYIKPETHTGEDTIHYTRSGSLLFNPDKATSQAIKLVKNHVHNHHLDDHMNSYKPANSITANSLSELLQIFKYTQVTIEPEPTTQLPPIVKKGWRYTKPPTTPTPEPSTRRIAHYNTYRYTTPPNEEGEFEVTSPIAPQITTTTEIDNSFYEDRVAETNSLDGYLFSDSEASPDYAHPEVKPNVIVIEEKDKQEAKGIEKEKTTANPVNRESETNTEPNKVKDQSVEVAIKNTTEAKSLVKGKMDSEAVRRGEFIPSKPLDPSNKEIKDLMSSKQNSIAKEAPPLYVIYQGHSKVQMYGTNNVSQNKLDRDDKKPDFYIITTTQSPTSTESKTIIPVTVITTEDTTIFETEDTTITPEVTTYIDAPINESPDYYYDYEDLDQIIKGLLANGNVNSTLTSERLTDALKGFEAPWIRPNLKFPNGPQPELGLNETDSQVILDYVLPTDLEALYSILPSSDDETYTLVRPVLETTGTGQKSAMIKETLSVEQPANPIYINSGTENIDIKPEKVNAISAINYKTIETLREDDLRKSRSKDYPIPKPRLISDIITPN